MMNITVLVSGNGSNLQAVMDAIDDGFIRGADIGMVISDNPDAYALERARKENIETLVVDEWAYPEEKDRADELLIRLRRAGTDLIILAGYLKILPPNVVRHYKKRIINIHPSLIPRFCGMGFYGKKVHQAVLDAGETETGATVHFVDEGVDTGKIILQEKVRILEGDTVDTLADRVLDMEHVLLVKATKKIMRGLHGRSTRAALFGFLSAIALTVAGVWIALYLGLVKLF